MSIDRRKHVRVGRGARWAVCLSFLLASARAHAHDFWIEPSAFRPAAGEIVFAGLRVGVGFEGDLVPRDGARIVKFVLVGPNGEQPLLGDDGADPAGYARVAGDGLQILAYESNAAVVDLDASKVVQYIRDEGLEPFLPFDPKAPAGIRDHYVRCVKSILMSGAPQKKVPGFDRRLGLPLELVPEANPYALPANGRLPVRLLRDGKPLSNVLVVAMEHSAPEKKVSARTDAKGRVVLALTRPGVWLVKAVHIVPAQEPGEWNSFWASMTFEVPPAGR